MNLSTSAIISSVFYQLISWFKWNGPTLSHWCTTLHNYVRWSRWHGLLWIFPLVDQSGIEDYHHHARASLSASSGASLSNISSRLLIFVLLVSVYILHWPPPGQFLIMVIFSSLNYYVSSDFFFSIQYTKLQ